MGLEFQRATESCNTVLPRMSWITWSCKTQFMSSFRAVFSRVMSCYMHPHWVTEAVATNSPKFNVLCCHIKDLLLFLARHIHPQPPWRLCLVPTRKFTYWYPLLQPICLFCFKVFPKVPSCPPSSPESWCRLHSRLQTPLNSPESSAVLCIFPSTHTQLWGLLKRCSFLWHFSQLDISFIFVLAGKKSLTLWGQRLVHMRVTYLPAVWLLATFLSPWAKIHHLLNEVANGNRFGPL